MKYTFFTDPSHGWLEVPVSELHKLGIANKITQYSYRHKHLAYLEEDCDASTFVDAYFVAYGVRPEFVEVNSNEESFVRRLPRYYV